MIEYMKGHEAVWFATGIEIAEWWLEQNFTEKPAPLRGCRPQAGTRARVSLPKALQPTVRKVQTQARPRWLSTQQTG
jgi:hypothetical protein